MNNPLTKVPLGEGIMMRDTSGEIIAEAEPMERDPSRQLTIHEYAAMKNDEKGLVSRT